MIGLLIAVATVLGLGYFVARHHPRFRDLGIGTAAGSAADGLPSVSDVWGRDGEAIPGSDEGDADAASLDAGADSLDATDSGDDGSPD